MGLINDFGIQLYSIREELEKDFTGALKKLSAIGYSGIEFFKGGLNDMSSSEVKKLLDSLNLKTVGTHFIDHTGCDFDEMVEFSAVLGSPYIINPWAPLYNKDEILRFSEIFNKFGEKIKRAGMKFAYHNHQHEFTKTEDGEYFLDVMLKNTDPELVFLQLDIFWVAYAGVDILSYIDKHKDRIKLLHVKQIKDMETKLCVNYDEGIIDLKAVIEKSLSYGTEQFILEQEEFQLPVYESLKINYDYIRSL